MPRSLIAALPEKEQQKLLHDLNYLNMAEIMAFCDRHSIPYAIVMETGQGQRKTGEKDRKGVILGRIRRFLNTGTIRGATCLPENVVCFDPLPAKLRPHDRLRYGQYGKTSQAMSSLLKELTNGEFRDGAIARIVAWAFWSRGKAPTFRQYAAAWTKAKKEHSRPNPEWAFLSDLAAGKAGAEWKQIRTRKAARVLKLLRRIPVCYRDTR